VRGDGVKLRQVLINLMGNAVKFTEAGSITLKVAAQEDEVYAFVIEDTGPGIPEEKQASIFEPFQQEEQGVRQGGTGLGLTITRAYVELLGGQIALASTPGEGSRFSFALTLPPGREAADKDAHDWERVRHLADGQQVYALIVDDVETNRDIMEGMLHKIGVETQTAARGEEALASVRVRRPDVVFLDIRMPDMDGPEVLKRLLHEHGEDVPRIVAVTASVLDHERRSYLELGFDDFLDKPLLAAKLYACLAAQLGVSFQMEEPTVEEVGDWRSELLSPDLRAVLEEAVERANATRLRAAIERLSAESPVLAAHLDGMARRYDMDGIREALKEVVPN
jgi:CheY-like chemotaxis protein